jgi:hypothetical protein
MFSFLFFAKRGQGRFSHSVEKRNPDTKKALDLSFTSGQLENNWIPAFAGMELTEKGGQRNGKGAYPAYAADDCATTSTHAATTK